MRIGSRPDDHNEIVNHLFFEDFDWDKLQTKELVAEYQPGDFYKKK